VAALGKNWSFNMPMGETGDEAVCVVVIQGALDPSWADYLGDLQMSSQISPDEAPVTVLTGSMVDFAAFAGLIARLQNLGLAVQELTFQRRVARTS
jgi:hypothetical protein